MRRFGTLLIVSTLAGACAEKPKPCFGIQKGDRFDIELVERYDENSSFRGGTSSHGAGCGPGWDFSIGGYVTIRVLDQRYDESRTCTGSIITLEPNDASQLEILGARTENIFPHGLFHGELDVRINECEGGMTFQIWDSRPTDDLFAEAEPGSSPFFYLIREYKAFVGCPALSGGSCGEDFVVNVHPHTE
jgi:hypothetical protein